MVDNDLNVRIRKAIDRFSERRVYRQMRLASSPNAAKKIAESLPGVGELLQIGPPAGPAVVDLLNQEASKDNQIVSIALYLLWRIPADQTVDTLTRQIASRQFTGINAELAAETFLHSLGTDVGEEDRVKAAFREAKKRLAPDSSQQK